VSGVTNEFRFTVLDCLEREEPYVLWRLEAVESRSDTLECYARFPDEQSHTLRVRVGVEGADAVASRLIYKVRAWHSERSPHAS